MIALCEFRFQLIRNMLNLRGHVRIWNYNSQSILTTTSMFWCGRVLWHSYCSRQSWLKKWLTKIQKKPDGWVGDVAIFVVGRSQRERGRGLVGGELRGTESECHGAWWLCRIVWVVSFLLSRVENLKVNLSVVLDAARWLRAESSAGSLHIFAASVPALLQSLGEKFGVKIIVKYV